MTDLPPNAMSGATDDWQKALPPSLNEALGQLRANRGWLIALGVGLVVLGSIAIVQAVAFTMASMVMIGILMIIGGTLHIFGAFRSKGWKHVVLWALSGVIYILGGIAVIANPVLASSLFTLMMAAALLMTGAVRIWLAFQARPDQGWGWLAFGGLVTFLLGLIVALGWPVNSLWLIGMFLGVDLIMQGWSWIALGIALRKAE